MNKNQELLKEFIKYSEAHPEERFWQALRNWSGSRFIFAGNLSLMKSKEAKIYPRALSVTELIMMVESFDLQDTFYWEEKNRTQEKRKNERHREYRKNI